MLELQQIIDESKSIVFFGGAGVSTESGIPDFRSETGIFKTLEKYSHTPEELLSHSYFRYHPKEFFKYYKESLVFENAEPNAAHYKLAELEEIGKLKAIITQNVDGLHQKAGSKNVLELHGNFNRNYCMVCGKSYTANDILNSEDFPFCDCGGIIKPDVVLYEEPLDKDILKYSTSYIENADTLIVGGTSLAVYPAAGLINYFNGKNLVLINKSPTAYDDLANLVINEPIGETLSKLRL